MSLHEYQESAKVELAGHPFYAIIMTAMRQADSQNIERLRQAFPDTWEELRARYDSPGGVLPGEGV